MTRTAAYQVFDVFERAIPLILELGYRGCSMETLINRTDFNRRAFYIEFANKEVFVQKLLEHYITHHLLPLQNALNSNSNQSKQVVSYFENYQQHIDKQGCLLVRLLLEVGKDNTNIQSQARHFYDNLQLAFIACIERAVAYDNLSGNTNAESLALKLTCLAQGMAVSNNIQHGESDALIVIKSLFHE